MPDLETPVAVYVPAEGSYLGIDPASGIVGTPKLTETGPRVLIDFEGNRFRAVNVETFADRCNVAHGRHAMSYPTTARAFADADELHRVGTFYRQHGRVELEDGLELVRLAKWLGLWQETGAEPPVDAAALARELRCTGRVFACNR